MAVFDRQTEKFLEILRGWIEAGDAREINTAALDEWPLEDSLVLSDNTALELGDPREGSIALLLYTESDDPLPGGVFLAGPDLSETESKSLPLAQVVVARGRFPDETEDFGDMKDVMYDTRLEGLMARHMPSRRCLWYKASAEALARGLSLGRQGAAIKAELERLETVTEAMAVFVTGPRDAVAGLEPLADEVGMIAGAMNKMADEMDFDCDSCDYRAVCDQVGELKALRARLREERGG